jgi:Cys-rich repeat protein
MDDRQFDILARVLSHSGPRRRVFAGVLGAALATALGRSVEAGPRRRPKRRRLRATRNNTCAHFCNATFPPGPARGKCKSNAAHGHGPCHECGPEAPAGHPDLCGQACCPQARPHCVGGTCQECAVDGDCGSGRYCHAGTCCTPPNPADVCDLQSCTCDTVSVQCGPDINCGTFRCNLPSGEGPRFCTDPGTATGPPICLDEEGSPIGVAMPCSAP